MDAETVQDLKQFAPLHGVTTAFDFSEKVFANADASSSIILPDFLNFAANPNDVAYFMRMMDRYFQFKILAFVRIMS